jgi:hypothetical protein
MAENLSLVAGIVALLAAAVFATSFDGGARSTSPAPWSLPVAVTDGR